MSRRKDRRIRRVRFTTLPSPGEEPKSVVRYSLEECQGIEKNMWVMFLYGDGPWVCGNTVAEKVS
mgnify:CR=1 FL=1